MDKEMGNEAPQIPRPEISIRVFSQDHKLMNTVKGALMQEHIRKFNFAEAFHVVIEYYIKHRQNFDITQSKVDEALQDVQDIET